MSLATPQQTSYRYQPPADLRGKYRPARSARDFAKSRGNFPTWTVVARRRRDAMAARSEPGDRELRPIGWRLGPGAPGIRFARSLVVLHLDPLAPCTPRLPDRRSEALTPLAASTALHVAFVLIAASLASALAPGIDAPRPEPIADQQGQDVRLVFLVSELPPTAGGGGGGGNQRPEPIRRAQGVGADPITLRVQRRPTPPAPVTAASAPAVEDAPSIPSIVLDAKPLASGFFDQTGLPAGGVLSSPSTGPGSGGGVGTGSGTGIGPGRGPGLGPGSGGGTGGGVYRPGGTVSPPRVIKEVRPRVHQRSDDEQGSRHGSTGSHRHARRLRVADPCRAFARRRGPRSGSRGGRGPMAVRAWAPWGRAGRRARHDRRSASGFADGGATGNAACFG